MRTVNFFPRKKNALLDLKTVTSPRKYKAAAKMETVQHNLVNRFMGVNRKYKQAIPLSQFVVPDRVFSTCFAQQSVEFFSDDNVFRYPGLSNCLITSLAIIVLFPFWTLSVPADAAKSQPSVDWGRGL